MRGVVGIILIFLIVSCSPSIPSIKGEDAPAAFDTPLERQFASPPPEKPQRNYSNNYTHPNFIISDYGVGYEKIISILSPINPMFFNGVNKIEFIYSNKDELKKSGYDVNALYVYDSRFIVVYVFDESDEVIKKFVIHELKHHYCWNVMNETTTEHLGCFLTAPIP